MRELYTREDVTEHYVSIDEDKRRCGGHNFNSTTQGTLEGRIIGSDEKSPPPQQYVALLPFDENGVIYPYYPVLQVWTSSQDGRFYFNAVPPGKYLLAINPRDCPSRKSGEFGRVFFPGVSRRSEAEIISVAEYERKKLTDFQMPLRLTERILSGVVLTADRMPVPGARVLLTAGDSSDCSGYSEFGETRTDEFGRFQIQAYEKYEYKIRAFTDKKTLRLHSDFINVPKGGNSESLEIIVSKPY